MIAKIPKELTDRVESLDVGVVNTIRNLINEEIEKRDKTWQMQ